MFSNSRATRSRVFVQALLLSVGAATVAAAQDLSAGAIENVVVTAQKRAENVQDVPISMTVLSGTSIDNDHDKDIHDFITRVPNINMVTQGINDVIYMRGFGSSPNNFGFDPDVSVYEDGIYGGRSGQFIEPLFDVDHVEVLRGPQGGLLGKNTAAGAISILTANPTSDLEGNITSSYNFLEQGTDTYGYISGPVADKLTARLAVKVIDQDGFLKNLATNSHDPHSTEEMGRLSLRYEPVSNFDVTGKVEFGNFHQTGDTNIAGSVTVPRTSYPSTVYEQEPYGPTGLGAVNGVTSLNSTITANYHFDDYTLTSISGFSSFRRAPYNGYDETNPSGGPTTPGINNIYQNGFPERFNQESEEVRFLSPTGQTFEYVLGAYVDRGDWNVRQNIFYNFPGPSPAKRVGAQYTDLQQNSNTYSAFALGTYHIGDDFRVLGSLRYTYNTKSGGYTSGTYYGTPFHTVITTANGNLSEGSVDPSLTLQYDAQKNVMLYAAVARGSKSGGFVSNTFGIIDSDFTFKPESSTNYEIGLKSTLDSDRIVLDAAVYHMQIKDLQVSSYVPSISSFVTNNAASATSQGVEASASWTPVDTLELSTSFAYLDAKYDSFLGAACLASDPISVCNPSVPASVAQHNLAGEVLEYSSKWTGNVQAHHTLKLEGEYEINTSVVASLRTRYFNADTYSQIYGIQPTAVKLDARIELDATESGWDFAIAGKNLTDQRTASNTLALPGSVTTQTRTISYMDEYRSLWVEASYKF